MTDPADEEAIPPSVMFTAFEAHFSGGEPRKLLPYDALMVRQTARAIIAETERCAAAVAALPGMGDTDCCGGFERCRDDAIEAIRGTP